MTTVEFDREFNILYDNISSNSAPGLNKYEKSVFLTTAQDELIQENYGPYNKLKKGFEGSEARRREFNELVKTHISTLKFNSDLSISENSIFFQVPNDIYYITHEQAKILSSDSCLNNTYINVIPTTQDEYNTQKKSPFRKPNKNRIWRFDIAKLNTNSIVELVSPFAITEYKIRYVKKPKPIILTDFESDSELSGLGLTVEGLNTTTECELNSVIHRDILNRAIELAIKSLRENTLQANVELNKRNV